MSPKVSANGHLRAGVQGKVLFLFTGNSTCEKKKKVGSQDKHTAVVQTWVSLALLEIGHSE